MDQFYSGVGGYRCELTAELDDEAQVLERTAREPVVLEGAVVAGGAWGLGGVEMLGIMEKMIMEDRTWHSFINYLPAGAAGESLASTLIPGLVGAIVVALDGLMKNQST